MKTVKRIVYDESAAGRRIIAIPTEMVFSHHLEELGRIPESEERQKAISGLSVEGNIYETAAALSSHLVIAEYPHLDLLTIVSMAAGGDPAGIKLLYSAMLAVQPAAVMIGRIADFPHVSRVMGRIERKKSSGERINEAEEWFSRKVTLLSMSKQLPSAGDDDAQRPWLSWSGGVRRALAQADSRWDEAVRERAKAEFEALDVRIRAIVASLDPERRKALALYLGALSEENRFRMQALSEAEGDDGSDPLILRSRLENIWGNLSGSLRESPAGELLAEMFEAQAAKAHTWPQLKAGTSLIRSLQSHPELRRGKAKADLPSCLYQFIMCAGDGQIEAMMPKGAKLDAVRDSSGFHIEGETLRIDLSRVSRSTFVDEEGLPVDVDWTLATLDKELSYKSLVLSYMDNDAFLVELLNNPKAIAKPGVVSLISARCRSLRVLSLVATRRELFTGFMNKDVPLNLLMNPSKIPLTSLRKFIHVRYVDKMTLQRMTGRGGNIREEVRREIRRYLDTVH